MEPVLKVTFAAAVAVALGGCAATDRLTAQYHEAKKAVGMDPTARPASQVSVIMQRRLASLPDAVNAGGQQPGLPGQVFLIGADGKPVDAVGDLVVTVVDETPRQPGQPPKTTEKWHFGPDVLGKLKVKDDRFGECYVLFLPWPADWRDVTRVAVSAEYKEQTAGAISLYALPVSINLDQGQHGGTGEPWKRVEPFVVPPSDAKPATVTPQQPIPFTPPVLTPPTQSQSQSAPPMLLPPPGQVPTGPTTVVVPRS